MAGRFDPVGVTGRRLRKARATTFKRIKKVKRTTRRQIAAIQGDIMNPFG